MSQIFPKSANYWSKASIFMLLALLVSLAALIFGVVQRSDFVTTANTFKEQGQAAVDFYTHTKTLYVNHG